jgi:hypothetical protein
MTAIQEFWKLPKKQRAELKEKHKGLITKLKDHEEALALSKRVQKHHEHRIGEIKRQIEEITKIKM